MMTKLARRLLASGPARNAADKRPGERAAGAGPHPPEQAAAAGREPGDTRDFFRALSCKTPDEQDVLLFKDEASKVARVCLRSGAKNALSGRMICRLAEVLDELQAWKEGRAVLLHGHDTTFCSGSDLVTARQTLDAGHQLAQMMQSNLMRFQRLPMIVVAYLEGYTLGGGAELALAADMRLMSASARVGFVHIKMGVCCGWGGGVRLVQLLGPARALELLSSGRLVGGAEARRLGLAELDECASLEAAMDFVRRHSVGTAVTIGALKQMIHRARVGSFAEALDSEARLFGSTWGGPAHVAALDANEKHNK